MPCASRPAAARLNLGVRPQGRHREELTQLEALRAYARSLNTLTVEPLEPLLADDFVYESQSVMSALASKEDFLNYFRPKLQTIAASGSIVFAEIGTVSAYGGLQPCVVLAQGKRESLVGLVLAKVQDGMLKRLDLCIVPPPQSAERSGEYPG